MSEKIDWEEMRQGYNRKMKTNYKYIPEFISTACDKYGIAEFAYILGISPSSIDRIRSAMKLTKNSSPNFRTKRKIFLQFAEKQDTSKFTALEMSKKLDISRTYIYAICKKEKFLFKNGYFK